MPKKLFIDCDPGVDDAMAIMMAIAAPDVEMMGISCCFGNTSLQNVTKNTLRILDVCKRLDIPVYRGCGEPLSSRIRNAGDYHGKDGLGDAPDPNAPGLDLLNGRNGVKAMIKTVKENPGEVTLVALGPLTNLAVAVQLMPNIHEKLKALFIMGGNTESRGNTSVCGEFNFVADTEAAYIVLERYTCPTYIATWEFSCRSSLPWDFVDTWLAPETEKAAFVKKISKLSMTRARSDDYQKEITAGKGFNSCDAYAMAAAIDDTIITESEKVAVTVELVGTHTRGMMVLDYMEKLKKKHKVTIIKAVDLEKFKKLLMDSVK